MLEDKKDGTALVNMKKSERLLNECRRVLEDTQNET